MTSSKSNSEIVAELASRGWLSLNKFCLLAEISYPTATKLAKEGKLEGIKVGGVTRIYAEEIRRFLAEGNKQTDEGSNTPHLPSNNEQDA